MSLEASGYCTCPGWFWVTFLIPLFSHQKMGNVPYHKVLEPIYKGWLTQNKIPQS